MVDELLKKHHPLLVPGYVPARPFAAPVAEGSSSLDADKPAIAGETVPREGAPNLGEARPKPPSPTARSTRDAIAEQQAAVPPEESHAKPPSKADVVAGRRDNARRRKVNGKAAAAISAARKSPSPKQREPGMSPVYRTEVSTDVCILVRVSPQPSQRAPANAGMQAPVVLPKVAKSADARDASPASDASTQPAWDDAPPPAACAKVACPTAAELRRVLRALAPLAMQDADAQKQLREMKMLVDIIEQRAARAQERLVRMQRWRLALDEHFFAKVKEDPRLTDGTWKRPVEQPDVEMPEVHVVEEAKASTEQA